MKCARLQIFIPGSTKFLQQACAPASKTADRGTEWSRCSRLLSAHASLFAGSVPCQSACSRLAPDDPFLELALQRMRKHSKASKSPGRPRGPYQRAMEQPSMQEECPVCMEPYPRAARTEASLGVRSFQCDHALCRTCDARLKASDDHRCPTCRAPRKGMTAAQAEPRRDRNAPEPNPEDFGLGEFFRFPQAFGGGMAGVAGMGFAMGVGPYGLSPEQMQLMRSRGTTRTIFFPSVAPTVAPPPVSHTAHMHEAQADAEFDAEFESVFGDVVDWDAAREAERERERTRRTVEHLGVPQEFLDALSDFPSVSHAHWNHIRGRTGRARGT